MKLLVLSALVAVALAQPVEFTEKDLKEWENFKVKFTRNYESLEEHDRKKIIFFNNLKKIQAHNAKYERDEVSFKLGVNQFSDWSEEERSGRFKVKTPAPETTSMNVFDMPEDLELPKSVDWRDYGIVTPVRDQGVDCYGAGWAFSAAGALEGQYFKKANNLIPLSPQNLIDCSALQGNEGCDRGWPDYAFNYIVDNKGLDTENSYPYEGVDGDCRYKPKSVGATMTKLVDIPANKEKKLMQAVAKIGPISACIDANHESFYLYGSGVYNETQCNKEVGFIDHCVLIVGYGTDEKGGDYWLVKNSWGTSWGMDGYIMMTRNNKNQCGIAAKAQYPVV